MHVNGVFQPDDLILGVECQPVLKQISFSHIFRKRPVRHVVDLNFHPFEIEQIIQVRLLNPLPGFLCGMVLVKLKREPPYLG